MLKLYSLVASGLVFGMVALSAAEASAKPGQGTQTGGQTSTPAANCSSGTVTAFGLGSYTSCIGSNSGQDVTDGAPGGGEDPLLDQLTAGIFGGITNWSLLEKVNAPGTGSVLNWFETNEGNGTWQVKNPIKTAFVLSLKTSTHWSAYYFDNSSKTAVNGGLWNTLGVALAGNGQNGKALSHASIFVVPGNDQVEVPEPGMIAALGLAALSSFGLLKQRKAQLD